MKLIIAIILLLFSAEVIVDSDLSRSEVLDGTNAPDSLLKNIVILELEYYSFDGNLHRGQLAINKEVESDVKEIFQLMLDNKFPIEKMKPIVIYDWNDNLSMEANNTSAFNYRFVAGTKRLSNHSFGKAIDINPRMNPVYYSDGRISPKNGTRDTTKAGTFHKDHFVVKEFKKRGWRWGGDWNSLKDYHHFDKPN